MNRIKGILAAGTLTGLVLVTALALGFQTPSTSATISPNPVVLSEEAANTASPTEGQALESYAQQLETALLTMQERESAYQTQINTANQTILELQDQVNAQIDAQAAQPIYVQSASSEMDDDQYESDDYDDYNEDYEENDYEEDDDDD